MLTILVALVGTYLFLGFPGAHSNDCIVQNSTGGTHCEVPYQASMLTLSCPGGNTEVKWLHTLRGRNYSICTHFFNRTCIVRGYEGRLSNDDSGMYYCIVSDSDTRKAMVTVLAPPQLTNVLNNPKANLCTPEVVRNSCRKNEKYYMAGDSFQLVVDYESVGPAIVRWYHNDTEIHCPQSNKDPIQENCIANDTKLGRSAITINAPDDFSVSGYYRGVAQNAYGTNETVTLVEFQCRTPDKPVPKSPKDVYYNLTLGDTVSLSKACQLTAQTSISQTICYTHRANATFKEAIANYSNCARCDDLNILPPTGDCKSQFGNNNHYFVTAHKESCPTDVTINFSSRENTTVTFADSGKIFCSYPVEGTLTLYTTVHINVVKKPIAPPNWLLVEVLVPAGLVLLLVMVLVIAVAVLGYKYREKLRAPSSKRLKRMRSEAKREALLKGKGNKGSETKVSRSKPNYGTMNRPHNFTTTDHSATDTGGQTECQSDWPHGFLSTRGQLPV